MKKFIYRIAERQLKYANVKYIYLKHILKNQ